MHTDATDITLFHAWQRHRDAEAFHALVNRHARLVFNTCRHIVRNDADAADVSQECFLRLASAPPDIQSSLAGWLHRLATHRALDHLKMAKRRQAREIRHASDRAAAQGGAQAKILDLVDEAIDALPDELRIPVIEHFLHQKSHQEVADALGMPRRTASHRIGQGVEQLRLHLKKRGVAVPVLGLTALLEQESAQAADVPASLHAALGKHALAGSSTAYIPAAGGVAAVVALKKAWIAAAAATILALAWWLAPGGSLAPQRSGPPPVPFAMDEEDMLTEEPKPGDHALTESIEDDTQAVTDGVQDAVLVGAISGKVYDQDSLDPIPGTKVVVASSGGASTSVYAITEADGSYRTPKLSAGPYIVYRDETPGYAPTQRTGVGKKWPEPGRIDGTHVTLAGDATVDFALQKGLVVAGTVLDKRERGVEGAEVMASVFGSEFAQSTSTDAEGRFALAGLTPTANLHVRVTKQGYGEAALSNLRLVAPGTDDLKIHLTNAASISGIVVDHHGQPLEGARAVAAHLGNYGGWSFDYPEGTSGNGGAFTIVDLAPGRYNVEVIPRGYERYFSSSPVSVALSEGEHRRDLRLDVEGGDGIEIAGLVTDQENTPLEGVQITLVGTSGRTVMSDTQGNFRIGGLLAGEYGILPTKTGYRERGKYQMSLDHSFRASRGDLHLVLEAFALRVEGVVRDSETKEPLSGFEVSAFTGLGDDTAITPLAWFLAARFANTDGSFVVDVEAPWKFEVGAEGPVCAVYVRKSGYAPNVTVLPAAGDSDTVYAEIELERGRMIEGVVADHHGAPVAGAIIAEGELFTDTLSRRTDLAMSDAEGRFEVDGLREDVDALTAIHPAHPLASAVIGDGSQSLRIVFGAACEVEGAVLMDGAPMPFRNASLESRGTESTFEAHGATDQWGKFHFGALNPGEYDLSISDWFGARVAAIYIKSVVVNPGQKTSVDFNLSSGALLQGAIMIDGAAPAWARVEFDVVSDEFSASYEPHVSSDGTWRIDNVTTGIGTLKIDASNSEVETYHRTVEIELSPGGERVVNIDLTDEAADSTEE